MASAYQVFKVFLFSIVGIEFYDASAKNGTGRAHAMPCHTCALCQAMIEDFVDDGASVLDGGRPVAGGCLVLFFLEGILLVILVVVCDWRSCAPCREADLDLRRGKAALGYEVLTLALLLGRKLSACTHVAIRLGIRAHRAVYWCGLVGDCKQGSVMLTTGTE